MGEAKPYGNMADFEAKGWNTNRGVLFSFQENERLRATVAALESVTKERDEARAAAERNREHARVVMRERDEARATLEAARTHTSLHASGCPLCVYEDGVLQAMCAPCNELNEARAEVERLKQHPCRDGVGSCRTETPMDLCAACALEVEVERLRADAARVAYEGGKLTGELRAEVERLRHEHRLAMQAHDCTHGDTPGLIHCSIDKPCTTHDAERLREALQRAVSLMALALDGEPTLKDHIQSVYEQARAALAGKDGG